MITALTFEKFHCNQFLKNFGLNVAEAVLIKKADTINSSSIVEQVRLPCFVKPTDGGSSFGITKVTEKKDLKKAIHHAFKHGTQVVIEEFIDGRELTNGVFKSKEGIKVLPVTEIITDNEFFDYAAKYNGESIEVTPADIDSTLTKKIKTLTNHIYDILNLKGIARIDYIVTTKGSPYIIEINTVPGQSAESIIPQVAEVEGIGLEELFGEVISTTMDNDI